MPCNCGKNKVVITSAELAERQIAEAAEAERRRIAAAQSDQMRRLAEAASARQAMINAGMT